MRNYTKEAMQILSRMQEPNTDPLHLIEKAIRYTGMKLNDKPIFAGDQIEIVASRELYPKEGEYQTIWGEVRLVQGQYLLMFQDPESTQERTVGLDLKQVIERNQERKHKQFYEKDKLMTR